MITPEQVADLRRDIEKLWTRLRKAETDRDAAVGALRRLEGSLWGHPSPGQISALKRIATDALRGIGGQGS